MGYNRGNGEGSARTGRTSSGRMGNGCRKGVGDVYGTLGILYWRRGGTGGGKAVRATGPAFALRRQSAQSRNEGGLGLTIYEAGHSTEYG